MQLKKKKKLSKISAIQISHISLKTYRWKKDIWRNSKHENHHLFDLVECQNSKLCRKRFERKLRLEYLSWKKEHNKIIKNPLENWLANAVCVCV